MTRYKCCMGHWPCSGKMKEQSCPEVCLCMEVRSCSRTEKKHPCPLPWEGDAESVPWQHAACRHRPSIRTTSTLG